MKFNLNNKRCQLKIETKTRKKFLQIIFNLILFKKSHQILSVISKNPKQTKIVRIKILILPELADLSIKDRLCKCTGFKSHNLVSDLSWSNLIKKKKKKLSNQKI